MSAELLVGIDRLLAERDAKVEARVREEIATEIDDSASTVGDAIRIARGGAA